MTPNRPTVTASGRPSTPPRSSASRRDRRRRSRALLGAIVTSVTSVTSVTFVAALAAPAGAAADYPNRPIVLLCPWAAGGGTDTVSRQVARYLEADLGVPVSVINATGGSGVTGHSRGANASPDGYTLQMVTVEINMLHWRGLTRLTWRDYTPLWLLNRDAAAVFVRAEAPWTNLGELLAAIRAEPGRLRGSGTATGGIWHLALAGWLESEGLPADAVRWIPYGGAGPSLKDLMSGALDVVCASVPEARVQLENGEARCLGVMATRAPKGHGALPTFASLGSEWRMGGWRGLAGPAGLPAPVTERLTSALDRISRGEVAIDGETFPAFMDRFGFESAFGGPDVFRAELETVDAALGKLLTGPSFAGLREESSAAMVYPGALAGLLALGILAAWFLERGTGARGDRSAGARAGLVRVAGALAAIAVYILISDTVGFLLAGSGILLVLLVSLGTRVATSIAVTVVVIPLTYTIFSTLLRVPLPRGWFGW